MASAAVLISLGALLGKLNPFQILMLSIIEAPIFVLNSYLGYTILGVADVGNISRLYHYKNLIAVNRDHILTFHPNILF